MTRKRKLPASFAPSPRASQKAKKSHGMSIKTFNLNDVFAHAVMNDNPMKIIDMYDKGFTFDASSYNGQNEKHLASKHNCARLIDFLEGPVNAQDNQGNTPLHLACNGLHLESIEALLKCGAQPNIRNHHDETPLFIICGGLLEKDYDRAEDKHRAVLAQILLDAGADCNALISDIEWERHNITALQKAAFRGYYSVIKVLCRHANIDVNSQDHYGNTALLNVFNMFRFPSQMAIFDYLTCQPSINLTIQGSNKHDIESRLLSYFPQNKDFMAKRRKVQIPPLPGAYWVKKFKVHYSSRIDKPVRHFEYDFTDVFATLKQRVGLHNSVPGNFVSARLLFVISDGAYKKNMTKIAAQVELNLQASVHVRDTWQRTERANVTTLSPDAKERIRYRLASAPDAVKTQCTDDITEQVKALSEQGIEALYQQTGTNRQIRSFESRFHHSEVALLDYLENKDTVKTIAKRLQATNEFKPGCKVYAIILCIQSKYYLCYNCELGILGEQNTNKSRFTNRLKAVLEQGPTLCRFPRSRPLTLLSLFSATVPYGGKTKKSASAHVDYHIDLRTLPHNVVLQQDSDCDKNGTTVFRSRYKPGNG